MEEAQRAEAEWAAVAAARAARARAEREEKEWLGEEGWGMYSSWLETLLSAVYLVMVIGLIRLGGMRVVNGLEVPPPGLLSPCMAGQRPEGALPQRVLQYPQSHHIL